MNPAVERLLRRALLPDEVLWWSGRPSVRRLTFAVLLTQLAALTLAALAAYLARAGSVTPRSLRLMASLMAVAGVISAACPLASLWVASGLAYAITSRRLLVISRFPWPRVRSYDAASLPEARLVASGDGGGDIRFAGDIRRRPMTLVGLSDAHTALRLLETLRRERREGLQA